jgi:hypothetical protein
MKLALLAYILIITAVYTGSLTDGAESIVTVETRANTEAVCRARERSIVRSLTWLGATDIRAEGCPER